MFEYVSCVVVRNIYLYVMQPFSEAIYVACLCSCLELVTSKNIWDVREIVKELYFVRMNEYCDFTDITCTCNAWSPIVNLAAE